MEWTDNDEELLTALLMYGNLQETFGEYSPIDRRDYV